VVGVLAVVLMWVIRCIRVRVGVRVRVRTSLVGRRGVRVRKGSRWDVVGGSQ
jgi:hypothetical protein